MMQHFVTTSADGSSTLQLTEFGEAYHSTNGAFTEAMHIYIGCGVEHLWCTQSVPVVNVFDVGLGTGLNCILVWAWQQMLRLKGLPYPKIVYWGIEPCALFADGGRGACGVVVFGEECRRECEFLVGVVGVFYRVYCGARHTRSISRA